MKYCSSYILITQLVFIYVAQAKMNQETDNKTKTAVDELLKKINEISVQSFFNASYSAKLEMLQKIEGKLKKGAKSLGKKGEKYVKLIMKGLKERALAETSNNGKKREEKSKINISEFKKNYNILSDNRIKSNEFHGDAENIDNLRTLENIVLKYSTKSDNENDNKHINFINNEHLRRMNIVTNESDEKQSDQNSVPLETSSDRFIQDLTPHYGCEVSLDKICSNIKETRQLKCHFDDSYIPIEKLCDGLIDCIDRTDEKFCTSQVKERIDNANQIISQVNESLQLGCYSNKSRDAIVTKQIIILQSILKSQKEFVEKYKYFKYSPIQNSDNHKGEGTVKRAVNELSIIISTLSLTLEAELCAQRAVGSGDEFTARKFNDLLIEDFDKVMDEVETPLKSCVCKEETCKNITTCTDACKRVCWHKYSLTRWRCPSINETENVPVSVICDGKFDCFDQSDERDCVSGTSFAKFEAHKLFNEILTSLSVKVTSKEYEFIWKMLLTLHSNVKDLQKNCMTADPDLKLIRTLRNKCLSSLTSIYSETLSKSSFLYLKSEVYLFLQTLSEKLMNALKHSHTGNKRIISSDGCFCRNERCVMPICSPNCQKSCVAEPWITRYFCKGSSNKSISLDAICNGISDCPIEDDETHCKKEICRRHHLTILRLSLQKIGKKQEGTSMGELLATWKVKVSSTLTVAENNERPTPHTIKNIIKDILNDLVITYGAVKDYRRDNEYALQEFTNIARYIMKFLRSCGH